MDGGKRNICCFFGHRHLYDKEEIIIKQLREAIEPLIYGGTNEFLFGGYGKFDSLCFNVVREYKKEFPHIKTVYVQAYYNHDAEKSYIEYLKSIYDIVTYPPIEDKPLKFAITYRNRDMIDNSDYCVFYLRREHGGAYQAYKYAQRKGKTTFNIMKDIAFLVKA